MGSIIDQGNGYWIKTEARRVEADSGVLHGIRYISSFHEPYGKRIVGYDHAHAVKSLNKSKYAGRRLPFGHHHRHVSDKNVPYGFESAYQ